MQFLSTCHIMITHNVDFCKRKRRGSNSLKWMDNKRPMGHIAHLRKQFKSIITYDYIIMLIKRRIKTLLSLWEFIVSSFEETWIPFTKEYFMLNLVEIGWVVLEKNIIKLHPRMLCAKFGWNCSSGSWEDFSILSMHFCYFVMTPLEKGQGPSFE